MKRVGKSRLLVIAGVGPQYNMSRDVMDFQVPHGKLVLVLLAG